MDRTVRNPTHNHQSYELTEKTIDSDFSYVNGMPQRADRLGEDDSRQCQPPYLYPEALAETIPFLNVINAFDICSAFFALVAITSEVSRTYLNGLRRFLHPTTDKTTIILVETTTR